MHGNTNSDCCVVRFRLTARKTKNKKKTKVILPSEEIRCDSETEMDVAKRLRLVWGKNEWHHDRAVEGLFRTSAERVGVVHVQGSSAKSDLATARVNSDRPFDAVCPRARAGIPSVGTAWNMPVEACLHVCSAEAGPRQRG